MGERTALSLHDEEHRMDREGAFVPPRPRLSPSNAARDEREDAPGGVEIDNRRPLPAAARPAAPASLCEARLATCRSLDLLRSIRPSDRLVIALADAAVSRGSPRKRSEARAGASITGRVPASCGSVSRMRALGFSTERASARTALLVRAAAQRPTATRGSDPRSVHTHFRRTFARSCSWSGLRGRSDSSLVEHQPSCTAACLHDSRRRQHASSVPAARRLGP